MAVLIATVLEHYGVNLANVPLAGWQNIRCPFHSDRMASAGVNIDAGGFACHACGMSGDAIKIIEWAEAHVEFDAAGNEVLVPLSYGEACDFARNVLGESIDPVSRTVPKQRKRRKLGRERWQNILE